MLIFGCTYNKVLYPCLILLFFKSVCVCVKPFKEMVLDMWPKILPEQQKLFLAKLPKNFFQGKPYIQDITDFVQVFCTTLNGKTFGTKYQFFGNMSAGLVKLAK